MDVVDKFELVAMSALILFKTNEMKSKTLVKIDIVNLNGLKNIFTFKYLFDTTHIVFVQLLF